MDKAVKVEHLTKIYKQNVKAVDDISFHVKAGEIFGFLGPNGAGKTTTIKILTTLLSKTDGNAYVAGYEVNDDPVAIRKLIGYTAQDIEIDEDLSGRENIVLSGRLYHLSKAQARNRANELLEVLGLTEAADRPAGTYSGGMRKRLDIASVLVHEPKIIFLDEPTTGLDPQSRFALWRYIKDLNQKGVTVFLTTQYMEEADNLCERLAIIDTGKIVARGTPAQLKAEVGGDIITLELKTDAVDASTDCDNAKKALIDLAGVKEIKYLENNRLALNVNNGGSIIPDIVNILQKKDITLVRLELANSSLDDVFLKYTGHELRAEEQKKKSAMRHSRKRRS